MSNFKFRLQKVLDIKIKEEEVSKIKYSKVQNDKKEIECKLDILQSNYTKYSNISNIKDIVTQKITANYLNSISYSIDKTTIELEQKSHELKSVRDELLNKQIERKSLEKLKENKLKSYKRLADYKEQVVNDEYAIYSYFRNKAQAV